jgi:CBS domain-containing protein
MRHLKVSKLMKTDVATVREDTPFHEIATLLAERRVSAVPVIDADRRVLGVVSQADLLPKLEFADEPDEGAGLFERRAHRRARHKATATLAKDLMSAPAVTVPDSSTVGAAARLLAAYGIRRMPVVDDLGRLVGIVSRGDLLKVYLRPDGDVRREIVGDILGRLFWITPSEVDVQVDEGVVTLDGELELRSLAELLVQLVREVDGVVGVHERLSWRVDNTVTADPRSSEPPIWPRRGVG